MDPFVAIEARDVGLVYAFGVLALVVLALLALPMFAVGSEFSETKKDFVVFEGVFGEAKPTTDRLTEAEIPYEIHVVGTAGRVQVVVARKHRWKVRMALTPGVRRCPQCRQFTLFGASATKTRAQPQRFVCRGCGYTERSTDVP